MSKAAFIVLAAGDTHESMGRVVNAFMGAYEYGKDDGNGSAKIIFDGAGTYEMTEKIKAAKIVLIDEFKGHPSFKKLIDDGYQVLVF